MVTFFMYAGIIIGFIAAGIVLLSIGVSLWTFAGESDKALGEDPYLELGCRDFRTGRLAWMWRQLKKLALRGHIAKPSLAINTFRILYPHIQPGTYLKVKDGTRYAITKPGTFVYAVQVRLDGRMRVRPHAKWFHSQVWCLIVDSRGYIRTENRVGIWASDLEALTHEEQQRISEEQTRPPPKFEPFCDGEVVELAPDSLLTTEGEMGGTLVGRFPEGFRGIVDNPDVQMGKDIHSINLTIDKPVAFELKGTWRVYNFSTRCVAKRRAGKFTLRRELRGPEYTVFIPETKQYLKVDRALLERREYDHNMLDRVVLDPSIRDKLLCWIPCRNPDRLREMGVGSGLLADKSNIMLFFGDRGTGKTLTAEALAEYLGVPFYPVDTADFGLDQHSLERGFKIVAERARRWGALVHWDEPEVFLEERTATGPGSRALVAVMLRCIELFEGCLLILSTNRGSIIDRAIGSRIPIQNDFGKLDAKKRASIWRAHIPEEMPLDGDVTDADIERLAQVKLDGRQIRNAVLLAAGRAVNEECSRVPVEYFLKAATQIYEDARARRKSKDEVEGSGPLGFTPRPSSPVE